MCAVCFVRYVLGCCALCILVEFHARIQNVLSKGVQLLHFLVYEGREDPNTTLSGSSSAHQRNAIYWRFDGVPMMAQY